MNGLYLLHFVEPIEHAQHYLGCSSNLVGRIEAHARGNTARLCEVFFERGIAFRLARLYICSNVREAERYLKKMNNGRAYCPICKTRPRRPRGLEIYPLNNYPLSTEIKESHEWLSTKKMLATPTASTRMVNPFASPTSTPESRRS